MKGIMTLMPKSAFRPMEVAAKSQQRLTILLRWGDEEIGESIVRCKEVAVHIVRSTDYEGVVGALIRARYTIDEELAIQRQRDRKPDRWQEYDQWCEDCKAFVRTWDG